MTSLGVAGGTNNYPTYATEYGDATGYGPRARENQQMKKFENTYDLNKMNPEHRDLEFVVPQYRRNSNGFRVQYPERLPDQGGLSEHSYLSFPPSAPRHPYSHGKYKVPVMPRDRVVPESKYKYRPYYLPPSEVKHTRYTEGPSANFKTQMVTQKQYSTAFNRRGATPGPPALLTPENHMATLRASTPPGMLAQSATQMMNQSGSFKGTRSRFEVY